MNKTRLSLLALAVAVICSVAVVPSAVQATNGATVITEFGCGLIAADSGLPINLSTTDSHVVNTPSGNTTLTCHFDIPEAYWPTQTMRNSGFSCNTSFGPTTNTFAVVSTDGSALLRCQIKANQQN